MSKIAFGQILMISSLIGHVTFSADVPQKKTDVGTPTSNAAQINIKSKPKASNSGVKMDKLLDMNIKTLNNKNIKLSDFSQSKVFLFVNTASKCGFTSQYEGLEVLHKKYKDKGLAVIGFPSNDFGAQEPGTSEEIQEFCKLNYGVTFPLMSKAPVKGVDAQPFYKELINLSADKSDVAWNFEKFLVTKDGKVVERFKSKVKPSELDSTIAKLL